MVKKMSVLHMDVPPGEMIHDAANRAVAMAEVKAALVSFTFNDVDVIVGPASNVELVERDWNRAVRGFLEGAVGPNYTDILCPGEFVEEDHIAREYSVRNLRDLILSWGGTQVDGDENHGTFTVKL